MTKAEFIKISKKCPWYYNEGEPRCEAQNIKHCTKKNCPIIFWIKNLVVYEIQKAVDKSEKPLHK